jgi:hypothetical protein
MKKITCTYAVPALAFGLLATTSCTSGIDSDSAAGGGLGVDAGFEPSAPDGDLPDDAEPTSCYGAPTEPAHRRASFAATQPAVAPVGAYDTLLAEVAAEFDIPRRVLTAAAYAETRLTMVDGHGHHGMPAAYGLMALRDEQLVEGARLAGVSLDAAKHEERASLRAGAALLDARAAELGLERGDPRRSDLEAWADAIVAASWVAGDEIASEMHLRRVYDVLREGISAQSETGAVPATLAADPTIPLRESERIAPLSAPDYPGAIWRPSPNYNSRPSGAAGQIRKVIVHTCEGNYAGCWSWLTNPNSSVSAHYVVSENGHEISQLVRHRDRAWHIGASYDCARNSNVSCDLTGVSSNSFTIGIEHAGFASQASFPTGQIQAGAELACEISRQHGIPLDEFHFVGHGQLQPWNRYDPGSNWPWQEYLDRAREACGEGGGLVVDSNNGRNDTERAYLEVAETWTATDLTPGFYGTGYYFAGTEAVCDPARFWFYLDEAGEKTIEGWWTAGGNRSARAPFIAFDADGNEVGIAHANQQERGSRWVELGTWQFSAGWNQIVLSRDTDGDVVIADAIRVR